MNNAEIGKAMVIKLDPVLPEYPTFKEGVRRARKLIKFNRYGQYSKC